MAQNLQGSGTTKDAALSRRNYLRSVSDQSGIVLARERDEALALFEKFLTERLRLATRRSMRNEDLVRNGSDELVTEVGRPLRRSSMTLFERGGQ